MENREERSRLSAIIQSSEDAIISKKLDGTITSWNPASEIIFGYTADEAIGKNISIIIPEELYHEEKEIIAKIKQGNTIEHFETTRKRKDGSSIFISLTVSPIKDSDGNIIGVSKIARDITIQKNAEEKQAMLAAIVDSSDDAIISKTLDGVITSWNRAAQKMFGYTEEEAIGKHISLIIPKDRLPEEKIIISNIRNEKKINHFETVRVGKNGNTINISLSVSPIKNKYGKIIGASKVARDISDKIELEKKQKLYTEKLRELNIYKDEFMAMASHELKTPLTVIKANLQILEYKMKNDPNFDFIIKTSQSVNKLTTLINNLLDVTKMQAGRLDLNISSFDIHVLLKEVITGIQSTTLDHTIQLKNNNALFALADREKIEQVIINLLTNAIKYSPGAKEIMVEYILKNDQIELSVQDYGIGIPEKDIQQIFTRFYRVSGVASTFSGSGIGLYISSEIIKQHNGQMFVESYVDKGSRFSFTIPAVL